MAIRWDCMIVAHTRRAAFREGHDSWLCLCGVAYRHRRRSESVAGLLDEVFVHGQYARAPFGRVWTEILAVNAQCYGDGLPTWYVSLPALLTDPVHVEGTREVRVARISPLHLEGVGSGVIDKKKVVKCHV